MKKIQKPMRTLISTAVASFMISQVSYAAGFSLYGESNGAAIGNVAAGIAAEGADASIGWYNPAGLVLIHDQQAVFGGVGIFPSSKLTGTSTFTTQPIPPLSPYVQNFTDLNGKKDAFVPSFHYALPLGPRATAGISMVSPFGLATDWNELSPVRYSATFTELLTTTVSPEIGGLLTDNFSIGAGIDIQYARVKFNSMLGSPAQANFATGNAIFLDSYSYNKGKSYGVGFHAGVLGMFNDNHTRIGLNYQSKIRHRFQGYSRLTGQLAAPTGTLNHNAVFWSNNLTSNNINMPDLVTLSGYQDINEKLAILGSVVYTGWSSLKTIQLNNVAASVNGSPGIVNSISEQDYKNTWRFSVGANYYVMEPLMLRAGIGYDQTPTIDAQRDVRLPDASRWTYAIGGRYDVYPNMSVDLGYSYLQGQRTIVNKTAALGASTFNVNAVGKPNAHLVGAQLNWTLDKPLVVSKK